MATRIEKKVWPEMMAPILSGKKRFDIRLDEFQVSPGDTLVLKEWDPKKKAYTGRSLEKKVTFVMKTKELPFWNTEEAASKGFIVMSIE